MGIVMSNLLSLNDLRAGFEAEDRLADMQTEYLRIMERENELRLEVKVGCVGRVRWSGACRKLMPTISSELSTFYILDC